MWEHFESVCHPRGEQGEADLGRLLLQCALLQVSRFILLLRCTVEAEEEISETKCPKLEAAATKDVAAA